MRHSDPKVQRLMGVPIFSGCRTRDLRRACALIDETARPAGTPLVHEGDRGREIMILASGQASVTRGRVPIATLETGALIGEIAILDGGPRTTTVVADTDVTLLVLDRRAFDRLVLEVPFIARRLLTEMAKRLRTVTQDLQTRPADDQSRPPAGRPVPTSPTPADPTDNVIVARHPA